VSFLRFIATKLWYYLMYVTKGEMQTCKLVKKNW
jgi:hypothetical protein